MDRLWRFRVMIVVGLVAALIFIIILAHNEGEKKRVALETEYTRVHEELVNRLNKAIPGHYGVSTDVKDGFTLVQTNRLDKSGANVVLEDILTGHLCRGWVVFIDGQSGGHFDTLSVDGCYDPDQPKRVFSSGIRIQ